MTLFELAKTVPIIQIIEHFGLSAHNQAGQMVMPCPFHIEKTGSFTIHRSKNFFKCFGCGQGGDGITFVEKFCNLKPKDAAILVCRIGNIPVDERPDSESIKQVEKQREQRRIEKGLERWANQSYANLCILRRTHWIALASFDTLNSDWQTRLEYIDYLLDTLQYGSLQDKLNLNRAARHGELGIAGMWLNGLR